MYSTESCGQPQPRQPMGFSYSLRSRVLLAIAMSSYSKPCLQLGGAAHNDLGGGGGIATS